MPALPTGPPELVPILSRGKHRNPRRGACFMEMASYLAGERWSDHPRCTHPLLSEVARLVNDLVSDVARPRLAGLIPAVIGMTSDDVRMDARISLRCARSALPIACADRQSALAVAILTAERVLAEQDGRPQGELEPASRWALRQVPLAAQRADRLVGGAGVSVHGFRKHAAPAAVRCAVRGIAEACVPDPDELLCNLLRDVVDDCSAWRLTDRSPVVDSAAWTAACRLTGTRG